MVHRYYVRLSMAVAEEAQIEAQLRERGDEEGEGKEADEGKEETTSKEIDSAVPKGDSENYKNIRTRRIFESPETGSSVY